MRLRAATTTLGRHMKPINYLILRAQYRTQYSPKTSNYYYYVQDGGGGGKGDFDVSRWRREGGWVVREEMGEWWKEEKG